MSIGCLRNQQQLVVRIELYLASPRRPCRQALVVTFNTRRVL